MQLIDVEELKKVLEVEPLNTIKTDGSIDRKTVIDFLSGIANLDPKTKGPLVMYVMSLPDIQPERKHGKWEPIGWSGRIHKCNQCGNMLDFGGVNAGRGDANFCPNCGADMRGGDFE